MTHKKTEPAHGPTNPSPESGASTRVERFGWVIGLKPEKEQYYRDLHADVWPAVLERLKQSNISNYSIYVTELDAKRYLFSYFEYRGDDFERDMRAMAEDPEVQRWWKETDPCQIQLPSRKPGAHWSEMERVFRMD